MKYLNIKKSLLIVILCVPFSLCGMNLYSLMNLLGVISQRSTERVLGTSVLVIRGIISSSTRVVLGGLGDAIRPQETGASVAGSVNTLANDIFIRVIESLGGSAERFADVLVQRLLTGFDMRQRGAEFSRQTLQGVVEGVDAMNPQIQRVSRELGASFYGVFRQMGFSYRNLMGKWGVTALGMIGVGFGIPVFWSHVKKRLETPQVVINTNMGIKNRVIRYFNPPKIQTLIWQEGQEERLEGLVKATQNTCKSKSGIHRNAILYGPPGTGKTSFARQWAERSGMRFVEITGSSFFQEGAGIAAIDQLFLWAKKKGNLFIFIDEFDSFAADREQLRKTDQKNVQLVNHFLNHIGTESSKFKIVVATNSVDSLDRAIDRRFPDKVKIDLPNEQTRMQVLLHYKNKMLRECKKDKALVESINHVLTLEELQKIASQTEGFSNGDLMYLVDDIKSRASITDDGLITKKIVDAVVMDQLQFRRELQKNKN